MSTIYEREYLLNKNSEIKTSSITPGFNDKPINRLATARAPKTILNIEANHIARTSIKNHPHPIVPLLEYQLWLEAGKMRQNYRNEKNDPNINFNSNIWRNFRSSCGFDTTRKGNVSESISLLYPINIPPASKVGDYTLGNYFRENKKTFFKKDKTYDLALEKVRRDDALGKFLRLKSDVRNPPIDFDGNILPPSNFKKYPSLELPRYFEEQDSNRGRIVFHDFENADKIPSSIDATMAMNSITKPFYAAKISYRDTHPDYDRVIFEQHIKGNIETANPKL